MKNYIIYIMLVFMLLISGCQSDKNKKNKIPHSNETLNNNIVQNTPILQTEIPYPAQPHGMNNEFLDYADVGNLNANLFRGGHISSNSEYQYFYAKYVDTDNTAICKSKEDVCELVKLYDSAPNCINVDDTYIYYIQIEEYLEGVIVRIDKSGNNRTILYPGKAKELILVGNWLYYFEGENLYKIRKDGTDRTNMGKQGMFLQYSSISLYYIHNNNGQFDLIRYDLITDEEEIIKDNFEIESNVDYLVTDNYIVFRNDFDHCLYRMNTDGLSTKKIIDFNQFIEDQNIDLEIYEDYEIDFSIYEGKLYITGSDKIAVYDLDGLFLKDIKISGWFCYNHLSGFSNGFIYYWQYVPEGDDYFMRVKFDGSCQEHLLLDENGKFTMPNA